MHGPVAGVQLCQYPMTAEANTSVARMWEVRGMEGSMSIADYASAWRAERNMLTAA